MSPWNIAIAVNDPPVLSGGGNTADYTEQGSAVTVNSGLTRAPAPRNDRLPVRSLSATGAPG